MSPHPDLLSTSAWSNAAALGAQFQSASPFRHVVIDDFLDTRFATSLLGDFPPFAAGNRIGDDHRHGGKSTVERITGIAPSFAKFDELVKSRRFLDWLGEVTGIDDLLYDPAYFGGGTHNNRHGQELHAHIDFNYHPSEDWHRRLNLIVYLNDDWNPQWGGNLELYRDPYSDVSPTVRTAPVFNRCVVFETTEHSWHGFDKIVLPAENEAQTRKSVAFYFYTKGRPEHEVAGTHTTHYVNRQLPEHFVTGHTLAEDDVNALRLLIAHRDNLLQRLYAENAELRQAYAKGVAGRILHVLKRSFVRYLRRA